MPRAGQHWAAPADICQSASEGQPPQRKPQAVHYYMAGRPEGTRYVIVLVTSVTRHGPYKNQKVARRAVEQMYVEVLHTHEEEGGQNQIWPMRHHKASHFLGSSTSRQPFSAASSSARRVTLSEARARS